MITVQVEIKHVASGKMVTDFQEFDDDMLAIYQFEDGNYSCDCNRAIFFARAMGLPEDYNVPCGDGGYLVRLIDCANGDVIYGEF
jgi:hypothetical protein